MKNKLHSLEIVVHTVTGENKDRVRFGGICPSHDVPDVETLLSLVLSHINEKCGTDYIWMHKSEVGEMLDATVNLMQASKSSVKALIDGRPTPNPKRKARIKKNLKELGY